MCRRRRRRVSCASDGPATQGDSEEGGRAAEGDSAHPGLANFKLAEFDSELEFVTSYEMTKAEQLVEVNYKALDLKQQRRAAKKNILKLREQAKQANSLELNALKAKQLKLIEENRASELKELQVREAKRKEAAFE